ncbi:MAG: hypothetical protein ACM3U1_05330 [Chloroflexota bacterium]
MRINRHFIFAAFALITAAYSFPSQGAEPVLSIAREIPDPPRACEKAEIIGLIAKLDDLEARARAIVKNETKVRAESTSRAVQFRADWSRLNGGFYADFDKEVAPLIKRFNSLRGKTGQEEQEAKAIYKNLTLAANTLCEKYYFGQNASCSKLISDYCEYIKNSYVPEILNSGSPDGESLAAAAIVELIETYKSAYKSILEKDLFYR